MLRNRPEWAMAISRRCAGYVIVPVSPDEADDRPRSGRARSRRA
jgi:hypothetical protein